MNPEYYDVYDSYTNTMVMKCVTKSQINTVLGCNISNMIRYVRTGYKANRRYIIRITRSNKPLFQNEKFIKEWEEAVRPFRRVVWCKTGGKELAIKKV